MTPSVDIRIGDCLELLRSIPDESVQCVVTSPPYWGLRDYKISPTKWREFEFSPVAGLPPLRIPEEECVLGLEKDPWAFVAHIVIVFRQIKRVLHRKGTVWMNFGDSYAANHGSGTVSPDDKQASSKGSLIDTIRSPKQSGLKPKDLCGIPWRVAFALQADGWYLRSDIIWNKPNPMPESVNDRPTKCHEYIFLLTKHVRYYYDIEATREVASWNTHARRSRAVMAHKSNPDAKKNGIRPYKAPDGWDTTKGQGGHGSIHKRGRDKGRKLAVQGPQNRIKNNDSFEEAMSNVVDTRNKRTVWSVSSQPFKEAHFATFPPDLIKPCILAGTKPGDTVLDPFGGSGTTGMVALELGRNSILIELKPEYAAMAKRRCSVTAGLAL